ncbi:MAG TPA: right-handed parallel beta-helix repeat-containing protein [Candidatus Saccharimonadales bacterium]|nr:right-handed parallel beta-helix repeat-containing protein [Candidatus Saccharimonadales bacterium]
MDLPVLLPDGTEFKTWEVPLKLTRTYYVDGPNPRASDANPGTKDRPFATVNRAAQVLGPGERVIVAAGVYREHIRPLRGGASPQEMISYEAAAGARVVLKGSCEFHEPWIPADSAAPPRIWQAPLRGTYFTNYNPFDIENVSAQQFAIMDFATEVRGKAPCNLPRGLIFQDGRRLTQVSARSDLEGHEGCYWVDRRKQILFASFFGHARPDHIGIEITTQESVFAPEKIGLGYIRVKGFVVEQAAGPFPWPQVGAISTTRGHHWIIEDNTVHEVNGVGIDVGIQLWQWPQPSVAGFHIVRRNTVADCGICGIAGMGPGGRDFGLLIEDNVLLRNAFYDVQKLYETGGIKTHNAVHCLIRHNLILDTLHGSGIWMDWDNRYSRCCQNVVVNAQAKAGAIFIEASFLPNMIDDNFVWGTQAAGNGLMRVLGLTGHGLYEHDCSHQLFVHNFIGRSEGSGIHLHGKMSDRKIDGHIPEYGLHLVNNNLLYQNASSDVYAGQPSAIAGNVSTGFTAAFDRRTLELTLSASNGLPACELVPQASYDFFGHLREGPMTVAGPFNRVSAQATKLKLWDGTFHDPASPRTNNPD